MRFLWASTLYLTCVAGLAGCGKSAVEAEYCALRKEVTELTAESASGLVNGTISPTRASAMMDQVKMQLPRLEELANRLPKDFKYSERCK